MDQLRDMLDYWMSNNPSTSWRCLADAIEAPSVGEKQLAKEIKMKYCSRDGHSSCDESEGSVQAKSLQGT